MGSSCAEQCLPSSAPRALTLRRSQAPTPLGEARPSAARGASPARGRGLSRAVSPRGVHVSTRGQLQAPSRGARSRKRTLDPCWAEGSAARSLSLSSAR